VLVFIRAKILNDYRLSTVNGQEIHVSQGIFEKLPNFIKKSTVNTAQYVVVAEDHNMHRGVVVIYPDDPANSVHDA
jgi:hypothetical protein